MNWHLESDGRFACSAYAARLDRDILRTAPPTDHRRMGQTPHPPLLARLHPTTFLRNELEAFEREVLQNPAATEHTASQFFEKLPKFLFMGQGREVRREVVLLEEETGKRQRVDFFRSDYGKRFWDIVELKTPRGDAVVGVKSDHPRFSAVIQRAIDQAEDYRNLIGAEPRIRDQLSSRGIHIFRPRILVVAARGCEELDPDRLEELYDRVRRRGPIEFMTYDDIFRFAKEHYQALGSIVLPASWSPEPISTVEHARTLSLELMLSLRDDPRLLRAVRWNVFEEVVAEFMASRGYQDVRLTGLATDTAADVVAILRDPRLPTPMRCFVEVKHWTARAVGIEVVDRVHWAMVRERGSRGWHSALIVAHQFTRSPEMDPERLAKLGIGLADEKDLVTWLKAYEPHPETGLYLPGGGRQGGN